MLHSAGSACCFFLVSTVSSTLHKHTTHLPHINQDSMRVLYPQRRYSRNIVQPRHGAVPTRLKLAPQHVRHIGCIRLGRQTLSLNVDDLAIVRLQHIARIRACLAAAIRQKPVGANV